MVNKVIRPTSRASALPERCWTDRQTNFFIQKNIWTSCLLHQDSFLMFKNIKNDKKPLKQLWDGPTDRHTDWEVVYRVAKDVTKNHRTFTIRWMWNIFEPFCKWFDNIVIQNLFLCSIFKKETQNWLREWVQVSTWLNEPQKWTKIQIFAPKSSLSKVFPCSLFLVPCQIAFNH